MILPLAILCRVRASVVNQLVDKSNLFSQDLFRQRLATGSSRSAAGISASPRYCSDLEGTASKVIASCLPSSSIKARGNFVRSQVFICLRKKPRTAARAVYQALLLQAQQLSATWKIASKRQLSMRNLAAQAKLPN
jgi:hypothetical protein